MARVPDAPWPCAAAAFACAGFGGRACAWPVGGLALPPVRGAGDAGPPVGAGLFPLDPGPAGTGLPCLDPVPSPCRIAMCFFRASSRILLYVASLPGTASNHDRRCSAVILNTSVQLVTFGTPAAVEEGVPARDVVRLTPGLGVLAADATGVAPVGLTGGRTAPVGRTTGFVVGGGRGVAPLGVPVLGGLASGGAVGCRFGRGCADVGAADLCGTAPGRGGGGLAAVLCCPAVTAGEAAAAPAFGAGLALGDSVVPVPCGGMAGLIDGGSDANGLGMLFVLYHASIAGLLSLSRSRSWKGERSHGCNDGRITSSVY